MDIKFEVVKPKLTVKDLKPGQLFYFITSPENILIKDDGTDSDKHKSGGYVWLGPKYPGMRGGSENYNDVVVLVEGHLVISVAK